ncbi:MAG TPA: pyridoxamine 5'-phosphate oxidase family protein [Anaerolineales bacterium]|nr:pyridoxamine 5'-phosphate oxidase family protein [Anaerolineales bacterium]
MTNNVSNYANKNRDDVRRKDYAVTDPAWIKAFLHCGRYGVLATTHEGQPYATPVNYVYLEDDHALYFHGARVGRTRANIALNPKVCFNVSEMGDLVPGERISNFGVDYNSVTVFGAAERVEDGEKVQAVLVALMLKYFPDHKPGEDYPLPEADELKRTAVYAIHIEDWTAKQQAHGED